TEQLVSRRRSVASRIRASGENPDPKPSRNTCKRNAFGSRAISMFPIPSSDGDHEDDPYAELQAMSAARPTPKQARAGAAMSHVLDDAVPRTSSPRELIRVRARPALECIRVLDLTNVLAGPFCAYQLGLLGAEVIKLEIPQTGDLARHLGADPSLNEELMAASLLAHHGGKNLVPINQKLHQAKEI